MPCCDYVHYVPDDGYETKALLALRILPDDLCKYVIAPLVGNDYDPLMDVTNRQHRLKFNQVMEIQYVCFVNRKDEKANDAPKAKRFKTHYKYEEETAFGRVYSAHLRGLFFRDDNSIYPSMPVIAKLRANYRRCFKHYHPLSRMHDSQCEQYRLAALFLLLFLSHRYCWRTIGLRFHLNSKLNRCFPTFNLRFHLNPKLDDQSFRTFLSRSKHENMLQFHFNNNRLREIALDHHWPLLERLTEWELPVTLF